MKKGIIISLFLLLALPIKGQDFASELQMSTEGTIYWYRICNAVPGMQDYVMTDCSSQDIIYQVQLQKTAIDNEYSLWKLTAVGDDGKVVLVNRATGLLLGGRSFDQGDHNPTGLITNGSHGYTITSLGDNAFSLQGVEDDGVERCLSLAERDTPAFIWPERNLSTSAIGWKFLLVDSNTTGIFGTKTKSSVHVIDKRIVVNGSSRWQLFDILGREIPHDQVLAAGIYLLKTSNEAVKVMIR